MGLGSMPPGRMSRIATRAIRYGRACVKILSWRRRQGLTFRNYAMSDDLFDAAAESLRAAGAPLADRMRPRTLDQFIGQGHILGEGKLLRRAIEADRVASVILFGPPGSGKTTLARIVANTTRSHFATLNAVLAGVKDIREQVAAAQNRLKHHGTKTILFVDEVHRFNKAQQDALLPTSRTGP